MKICLVTAAYPTKLRADSGIFIRDQALMLSKMKCEVSVVVPQIFREDKLFFLDDSVKVYRFPFLTEERFLAEYHRIPIMRVFSYLISGILRTWQMVKKESPELIHAHWVIPTGLIGTVVAKYLTRKPIVVTAHRADISTFPQKSRIAKRLARFVLEKADHIVAVSSALEETIKQEYGIDEAKLSVINMGVNNSLFRPHNKKAARQSLGLPEEGKIVLYAGGLISVKGLEYLLLAASEIVAVRKDVVFILVGAGSLEERLKAMALELGLSKSVKFVGERPHEEIALWIGCADVVALPSLDEGLPLLVLEALASGVPVVASEVGGVPEMIKNGRNGFLVEPGDTKTLAEKIMLLVDDENLYKQMVNNCTLPDWCDIQKNAERLVEIYQRVLKK